MKNRTVWLIGALGTVFTLILSACMSAAIPEARSEKVYEEPAVGFAPDAPEYEVRSEEFGGNVDFQVANLSDKGGERLVIKNASLSLVVPDPSKSMDKISQMAEEMGGFVVTANMYKETLESGAEVPRASITIRVPSESLNQALAAIKAESNQDPLQETISSEDVTSEYTDLQSRLKNLELAENQLAEIMAKAEETEDVLSVYNQLVQVREQIEVIKGQIKYYEQSAALSAISVELIADEAIQPLTIGGWQPQGVVKNAVQALIDGMKFLVNALIWVVIFVLPLLLVFYGVFIWPLSLVWRAWRRRRAARKQSANTQSAPQSQPEEIE